MRGQEKKEYDTAERELVDVIDTLDRAINIFEKKSRGSALMQATVNTNDVSAIVHAINAVVEIRVSPLSLGAVGSGRIPELFTSPSWAAPDSGQIYYNPEI